MFYQSNLKIAIIGLGYVGLPLAVEFGKHFPTLGFDINSTRVDELARHYDRTDEISSAEISNAQHLIVSSDEVKLKNCNVFIVTVPTPVDEANMPDLEPLMSARKISSRLLLDQHLKWLILLTIYIRKSSLQARIKQAQSKWLRQPRSSKIRNEM